VSLFRRFKILKWSFPGG